jgi:hypothetical protein
VQIDPETYRIAAAEHATLARDLYSQGRYVYAVYTAGVSVECVLRSRMTRGEFDARHDLPSLMRDSGFLAALPPRHAPAVSAALGEVWLRWRNSHRYLSLNGLKRFLVRRGLHRRLRGDPVKENTRMTVENALIIVEHGVK